MLRLKWSSRLKSLLAIVAMIASLSLAIAPFSHASSDNSVAEAPPEVTLTVEPVRNNIYMVSGSNNAGNVGVVDGDIGPILIDSQMGGDATEKLIDTLSRQFSNGFPLLINTHWHFDHVGGNEKFGTSTAIAAHENALKRMATEQTIEALGFTIPASPSAALPVITFSDTSTFHLNDEIIHCFHVKDAHTDGDIVVHFKNANVIHSGDLIFNGFYPFIDVSSGGNINGMIDGVDQMLAIANDDTIIIPGHGPLLTPAELMDYRTMLMTVRDRMAAAITDGNSLEKILELKLNADYDDALGDGFLSPEQFTTILYQDLSRP